MISIIRVILSTNRIVVIDTLSYCNSFDRRISIQDAIELLRAKYGPSLFIFVIKKQYQNPDYHNITTNNRDTMIVECNDEVFIMQNRNAKAVDRKDWESEADDHMTQLIERVIALTGCAAFHEGVDKYRNAEDVAKFMPTYPYHTYMRGCKTDAVMSSTDEWITTAILSIMLNGPRLQCVPGNLGLCRSKRHVKYPCCRRCGVCIECQLGINIRRNSVVSRLTKLEVPLILRKLSRYTDFEDTFL
jgi:hypothetical protein